MKDRRGEEGWVLQLLVLALFQWHVLKSTASNEYKYPTPWPYALSPTYFQYLASQERKIYNAIKVYEEGLQERLNLIKKYLKDYESSTVAETFHLDSEEDRDKMVVQYPILAFRMLSRFAKDFDAIDRHISTRAEKVILEVKGINGILPKEADVEEAVTAFLFMQFVYDLPTVQIANGQIPGGKSISVNLTTEQCYYIAKNAHSAHQYTLALQWFDEIKRRVKNDPQKDDYGITESSLEGDILAVIKEHNLMYEEEEFEDSHESLYSEIVSVVGQRPSTMRHEVVSRYSTTAPNNSHPNFPEIMFARNIALCNGQNIRPAKDESKLKCWLDRSRNPYWSILPLKIELLNDSPQVIQIHDFISDSWISEIKKIAYADVREMRRVDEEIQTAGFSWHSDEDIAEVPLSRKIELATGLRTKVLGERRSSNLQLSAHSFGGSLGLHTDSNAEGDEKGEGESVFTFLIYLNDVDVGGFTVFPILGIFVKPKKGSAIFWTTKESDGGSCYMEPVL